MNKSTLLSKKNLEEAFAAFDKTGTGRITVDELKSMLGGADVTDSVWE
jgi:Ca2+-binding EF-hand superfamily protein